MNLDTATKIKDWVRDFFIAGHKSSNKWYHPDGPSVDLRSEGWEEKYYKRKDKRWDENQISYSYMIQIGYESYYDAAKGIKNLPPETRGGNCTEMSVLAAFEAVETYHELRKHCFLCSITSPGDHKFALIADKPISVMDGWSVTGFARELSAFKWLVIDPWLNTACVGRKYLEVGGAKLDEWTRKGKLVLWDGPRGPSWYAPGGPKSDYKLAFETAPVVIRPF